MDSEKEDREQKDVRLASMELRLRNTAKRLAALIALETLRLLARLERLSSRGGFVWRGCVGLDLVDGFVLVLFEPVNGTLDCGMGKLAFVLCVLDREGSGHTVSGAFDGELGALFVEAHVDKDIKITHDGCG